MPFPNVAILYGIFLKFLTALLSVMISLGMFPAEKRGDDPPADPSAPYVFEDEEEYMEYYRYQLSDDRQADPGEERIALVRETEADGFRVCLCKNGTAAVVGLTKSMQTARFPASVEGYPVVAIIISNDIIDSYHSNLRRCTSVIIPNTVEYIEGVFHDMYFLQNFDMGERVRYIYAPCTLCTTLKSVKIPGSLQQIDGFESCWSLKDVEICRGVDYVGGFDACAAETLRLPDTVTELGPFAFQGCDKLKDLYLPASVTEIGYQAIISANDTMTIHGVADSYAEAWAAENGYRFVADY